MNAIFVIILGQLLLQGNTANGVDPEIEIAPTNMTVGLGHPQLSLNCVIRGEDLCWIVNGVRFDVSNKAAFRERGITFSSSLHNASHASASVMVEVTAANNETEIVCEALSVGMPPVASMPAIIAIVDVPLPPDPVFSVVNALTVLVKWKPPFTEQEFPIINYSLVIEQSNLTDTQVETVILGSDMLSYSLTQVAPSSSCTNLTFMVSANNSIGQSSAGIVQGAFPSRPGVFIKLPTNEVTFSKSNTPILKINFTFPSVCPYHNATYHIAIVEINSGMTVNAIGPFIRYWNEIEDSTVTIQLIEEGLQINKYYNAIIDVITIAGEESTSFTFDTVMTNIATIVTTSITKGSIVIPVVLACIGTLLVVSLSAVTVLCCVYVFRRSKKRNREQRGVTETAANQIGLRPMVNNPIYEGGVIYEAIPELKSLSHDKQNEAIPAYAAIASNSPCTNENDDVGLHKLLINSVDDTYTTMNPIGPLRGPVSGEVIIPDMGTPGAELKHDLSVNNEGNGANDITEVVKGMHPEERYVII